MLCYRNDEDEVKCKIFLLTLTKVALAWYRGLKPNSISSWFQFTKLISSWFQFTELKAIHQVENETLREYIERFNDEALDVRDLNDKMRWWFMENGLRLGSLFQIDIGINRS